MAGSSVATTCSTALLACQDIEDDERPGALIHCLDESGTIDPEKYLLYTEKQNEMEVAEDSSVLAVLEERKRQKHKKPKRKHYRRKKSLAPYYFDENGQMVLLLPRQTVWYLTYVRSPPTGDPKFKKKFRRRFRMPHQEYCRLVDMCKQNDRFSRWVSGRDCVGKKASPIELLVLGALRYLGRGLTFDDLEEYTAIHEETHRVFFHVFIEWGGKVLHPLLVQFPTTADEYARHVPEFATGGLAGAGFSTDATNVILWRCQHNLKQMHMGFKQSHTARSYNLTTNHRREILHTTKGHPSRWNDKTLAMHDVFMTAVHKGTILQDYEFVLMSRVGNSIVEVKYRGAWGLVDNGYHKWACTQAPGKNDLMRKEQRVSEWIESFRKDSECVFGILKGRWRILKTGIRLEGCVPADNIWLTCCALHNWLLKSDGLAEPWDAEIGDNDAEEMEEHAPFALQRLCREQMATFGSRDHELQAIDEAIHDQSVRKRTQEVEEANDNVAVEEDANNEAEVGGAILVNSLSYVEFRKRLVEHFDILHRQGKVKWPVRHSRRNN